MLALSLVSASSAVAGDTKYERATLAGLSGVAVVVEHLDLEVERAGLTESLIQTDAELRLRLAGIQVLGRDEINKDPGRPLLYLFANIGFGNAAGPWAYSLSVSVQQRVKLERATQISLLTSTWSVEEVGYNISQSGMADAVRSALKDNVDQFINAYLSVNPKK